MVSLRGRYGGITGQYDIGPLMRRRVAEAIVRKAGLWPGDVVLDVGCGDGLLASAVGRAFTKCRVAALEENPKFLKLARENARLELTANRVGHIRCDLTDIPFRDESIRIAMAGFAFHRVKSDPLPVLAEIHRVLEWYGKLMVVELDFTRSRAPGRIPNRNPFDEETLAGMKEMGWGKIQVQKLDILRDGTLLNLITAKRFDPEMEEGDEDEEDEDFEDDDEDLDEDEDEDDEEEEEEEAPPPPPKRKAAAKGKGKG